MLKSRTKSVTKKSNKTFLYRDQGSTQCISNVCTKANRSLGFLRRNLYSCPPDAKEAAYKGLVRPVLEYESSVWDPHTRGLQEELEKV